MKLRPARRWLLLALIAAAPGCGREMAHRTLLPNQPPEIHLDRPSSVAGVSAVEMGFRWRATDVDGRIDHYVYALDPANVDRVDVHWGTTKETGVRRSLSRPVAMGRASAASTRPARDYHVFAVRAVDDQGEFSIPASVSVFDSGGLAPTVVIDNPSPNAVFTPIVPPTVDITWHGEDLDGRIVKYRFHLFGQHNPDHPEIADFAAAVRSNPDLLRELYGPTFSTWEEVRSSVTTQRYTDLAENQLYVFAITAVDNDGNVDPVFSLSTNVLVFAVTAQAFADPQICVSSPTFNYCPEIGGDYSLTYEIAPSGTTVTWAGIAPEGNEITGYRWALDPPDTNQINDHGHSSSNPDRWTSWSLKNTSATIGPFEAGTQHALYIQARDNVDRMSTVILRFTVVGLSPARELLIVDDTRLTPDQLALDGTLSPPRGTWPTAAELDTFLYARGGNPWRGYPAGTLSPLGILSGYDFDTVGTRGLPGGIVPLSLLTQYRQVMWLTDDVGATYVGSPIELLAPITSLRLMSQFGQSNTLAAYTAIGGKVWLSGGGAAYATLISRSKPSPPFNDWTNADGELVPGTFMYDFPHWRSAVAIANARQAMLNTPDFAPWPNAAVGRGWSGQPDYTKLAAIQVLSPRTCATDPAPPQRFCNSFYLLTAYPAEYIGRASGYSSPPNVVVEDFDPRPHQEQLESTLDTLYLASGSLMPGPLPVMTYYHGTESGPVVFSGFPVWFFQKAQCQKLVDFVLQDIWHLSKSSSATLAASARRR